MNRKRPGLQPYLFIGPALLFVLVFSYYPAITALVRAFYHWDGVFAQFVGLQNFKEMLGSNFFAVSVRNIAILASAHIAIGVTCPLAAALLLHHLKNRSTEFFYRVLMVIPMLVPFVVVVFLWKFLYSPEAGVFNALLEEMGLGSYKQGFLGDPSRALFWIIFVGFPWVSGFPLLIYVAALGNIPESLYDASAIDGAGGWQRLLHIELPMIAGQVKVVIVLNTIGAIQQFANILLMTNGGPGDATYVPGLWMYNVGIGAKRMGLGCAIGFSMFVVILLLTIINMKVWRSSPETA